MDKPFKSLKEWGIPHGPPLIIAGPCAAESEAQVMEIASGLKDRKTHVFRAGLWKPRTRPGTFEGVGRAGLPWVCRVRDELDLPVVLEVAQADHVEACLEHGIDLLWIGARTTSNPFSVAEIANALRGSDTGVLVKNPTAADLPLWIGAFERLASAGIQRLAAVHRGFTSLGEVGFRNLPCWRIPIELRRLVPGLPLIGDPSHMAGSRELVPALAQLAMDLLYDGLMIEVHAHPEEALSDGPQQLDLEDFAELMSGLVPKAPSVLDPATHRRLAELRRTIDTIDKQLLEAFHERAKAVREIGRLKRAGNIASFQPERWEQVLTSRVREGTALGLTPYFVKGIFEYIHEEALYLQGIPVKEPG